MSNSGWKNIYGKAYPIVKQLGEYNPLIYVGLIGKAEFLFVMTIFFVYLSVPMTFCPTSNIICWINLSIFISFNNPIMHL